MHQSVNPKWRTWFDQQSPEVQAAVEAKWEETASDPDIVRPEAYYARLAVLLAWCAETHGYDFT